MCPLFTIISVTLNPGERLQKTVASVASQTLDDYEYLVKDGGSTDATLAALTGLPAQTRVVVAPDGGVYDAMNQAAKLARGRFLLFLNAGDQLCDAEVLSALAIAASPDTTLLYGDYFAKRHGLVMRSPARLSRFFLFRTTLCHQSWLVSSEAFGRAGGFDTTLRIRADADLLARLCLKFDVKAVYCPRPICVYEGGGMCETVESARIAREEAVLIRRRYFPVYQRAAYSVARAATLPELRATLTSGRHPRLGKMVLEGVNRLYRR